MQFAHNSDPFPYVTFMQQHYRSDVVSELHELRMARSKVTNEELAQMLGQYKAMI